MSPLTPSFQSLPLDLDFLYTSFARMTLSTFLKRLLSFKDIGGKKGRDRTMNKKIVSAALDHELEAGAFFSLPLRKMSPQI